MKKILALLVVIGMGSVAMAEPITLVNADFESADAGLNPIGWTMNEAHVGAFYAEAGAWAPTTPLNMQDRAASYAEQAFLTTEATADSFEGFNVSSDMGWRADNGVARSVTFEIWNVTDGTSLATATYNYPAMVSIGLIENQTLALTYDNTAAELIGDTIALRINNGGPNTAAWNSTPWLDNVTVTSIPEPATLGMVALFGGGILFIRRKLML